MLVNTTADEPLVFMRCKPCNAKGGSDYVLSQSPVHHTREEHKMSAKKWVERAKGLGMSQRVLAVRLGTTQTTISSWYTGKSAPPAWAHKGLESIEVQAATQAAGSEVSQLRERLEVLRMAKVKVHGEVAGLTHKLAQARHSTESVRKFWMKECDRLKAQLTQARQDARHWEAAAKMSGGFNAGGDQGAAKLACSILGVSVGTSFKHTKKAYRDLVSKHHPDKGGDAFTFRAIQGAWDALVKAQGWK
jgi:DNA-binding transcriptional regulator YiaG/DnaJ-domain-containing protein 1